MTAGYAETPVALAFSIDPKMNFPSSPPRIASQHRSGWGIIPSTFLSRFTIPAIFASDPFGLNSGETSPSGLEYRNSTWSFRSISASVSGSAK
jgi:hypothetical protein